MNDWTDAYCFGTLHVAHTVPLNSKYVQARTNANSVTCQPDVKYFDFLWKENFFELETAYYGPGGEERTREVVWCRRYVPAQIDKLAMTTMHVSTYIHSWHRRALDYLWKAYKTDMNLRKDLADVWKSENCILLWLIVVIMELNDHNLN